MNFNLTEQSGVVVISLVGKIMGCLLYTSDAADE